MYLIGTLTRSYYSMDDNQNPMSLGFVKEKISKEDLMKAAQDEDYQVINLLSKEYFDPKKNQWVKIERL